MFMIDEEIIHLADKVTTFAEEKYGRAHSIKLQRMGLQEAAWAIDELKKSLRTILKEKGIVGLMEIRGIDMFLGKYVADYLEKAIGKYEVIELRNYIC